MTAYFYFPFLKFTLQLLPILYQNNFHIIYTLYKQRQYISFCFDPIAS